MISSGLAICEFFIGTKQQSDELGTTWWEEIVAELKFAFKCHGSTKEVGTKTKSRDKLKNSVDRKVRLEVSVLFLKTEIILVNRCS